MEDRKKRNEDVYCRDELFSMYKKKEYDQTASEAAFLLGGIGTGNVSVGVRGQLKDWEIFNSPGKGTIIPYAFAAIRIKTENKTVCKVLESRIQPPYSRSHGYEFGEIAGLPRFESSVLSAEYPIVEVELSDRDIPTGVKIEAFTPFIPLDSKNSGIPCAILRYQVTNISSEAQEASVVVSLSNLAGFNGLDKWGNVLLADDSICEYRQSESLNGIFFRTQSLSTDDISYGNIAITTTDHSVTYKKNWLDGGWNDGILDMWSDFCDDGELCITQDNETKKCELTDRVKKVGSLCVKHIIAPGEKKTFEFILSWYFPNRQNGWYDNDADGCCERTNTVKNYYSTVFADAWNVADYTASNLNWLEKYSREFSKALYTSTLPDYILDAVSSNITVLRSTTCFRIQDGTFLGWEGGFDKCGSCWGSSTHVWNYAQTLAFLFPDLEQSMRLVEFNLETDENGRMAFRTNRVFGRESWNFIPAVDGQMGTIVRLYRDWKLSGNDVFLHEAWSGAKRALDFAFDYWDKDHDCVLDAQQHNTYDIEFYGINSLSNTLFFAALKAGAEMAEHLGDAQTACRYKSALEQGSALMDKLIWQGEYYIQKLDDKDAYRYQFGDGCLSDQVMGQWLAHVADLGYVLPEEHVKKAIHSVYTYNFCTDFTNHINTERTYAINNEKGLLLCTWPIGNRPQIPFVYCDEVWSGVEYQVASHLIYEGFVEEGLTVVKALRERYDGSNRNPWNEIECGNHYARSMASWSLLTALCGFKYNMVKGEMSFHPRINGEDFSTFWSTAKGWGIYKQKKNPVTLEMEWELTTIYGSSDGLKVNHNLSNEKRGKCL